MLRLNRHPESGATLVLVAVMIVALLAVGAIAVDIGMLYTARTSAQHAADSAALAGAAEFLQPCNAVAGTPAPPGCGTVRSVTLAAQNAAIAIASRNAIFGTPVVVAAADVNVDEANRRVTVTVRRAGAGGVTTFFARVFGVDSVDVLARARAEASATGTASRCIKPIYLPNTILSDKDPAAACSSTPKEVVFDSTNHMTDWAKSKLGSLMSIRPTKPPGALVPSQFYSLDFGSGATTYRCAWSECLNDAACKTDISLVRCGNKYPVETGNMNGPTQQGVEDLIGSPPDTWVEIGKYNYQGNASMPVSTSRALSIAPVWDNCDPTNPIVPGTHGQNVQVVGFVEMFVDGYDAGNDAVMAHLVNHIECGAVGAGPTGENTGPMARPVRLVQNP